MTDDTLGMTFDESLHDDATPPNPVGVLQWDVLLPTGDNLRVVIAANPDADLHDVVARGLAEVASAYNRGTITRDGYATAVLHLRSTLPTYRDIQPGQRIWGWGEKHGVPYTH